MQTQAVDTFKNARGWLPRASGDLGERALGAVLAGLRLYQDRGLGSVGSEVHGLATDCGTFNALDASEIDALAEAINRPDMADRLGELFRENCR